MAKKTGPKQPAPAKVSGSNKGGGSGKTAPLPKGAPGGLMPGATQAQGKNKQPKAKKKK
jgi:hypothetical protein